MDTQNNQPHWWTANASTGGKDIFISHSSRDATIAGEVRDTLERAGMPCWIAPRDVPPGQIWAKAIVDGLRSCRVVVLIFSRNADASEEVLREIEQASRAGKRIVTVRVENVTPSGGLAYFLSATQWFDAVRRPLRPKLDELVARLRVLLDLAPAPSRPRETPREVIELDLDHLTRRPDQSTSQSSGLLDRLFRDR